MFLRFATVWPTLAVLHGLAMGVAAGAGVVTSDARCTSMGAHLTVTNSYNATGHWLTALRLERSTRLPGRPAVVLLDVQPSSSRCGDVRTDVLLVSFQGSSPPSSPGYDEVPGVGYYKVHEEHKPWEEAKLVCESEGAHLLILNSEAEATAVQKLLQKYPSLHTWVSVGFNDQEKEGTYATIFGEPLSATGFTRWHKTVNNGGDGGTGENCGSIHKTSMGLNDISCTSHTAPFVCEQYI